MATVRRFLKAGAGTFTVISAILAFSTFVVKDYFLDQLKENADSIDAAQSAFIARDESIQMKRGFRELSQQIVEQDRKLETLTAIAEHRRKPHFEIDQMFDYHFPVELEQMNSQVESTARLAEAIALSPTLSQSLKYRFNEWKHFRAGIQRGGQLALDDLDHLGGDELALLSESIIPLAEQALKEARESQERKEGVIRILSRISISLIFTSALLALVGKVSGLEGATSDAE